MTDDTTDSPGPGKELETLPGTQAQKPHQPIEKPQDSKKLEPSNVADEVPKAVDEPKTNATASEKAVCAEDAGEVAAAVVVQPPDGGWGWVVVAASFVCNFFVDGMIFSFGPFLTEIQSSLDTSYTQVALVASLLSGCYLLAGMVFYFKNSYA